jgi:hypothetical protein
MTRQKVTRRDFLAGAAAGSLLAGFPLVPRPAVASATTEPAPAGAAVARVRIYPAIGISRVGSSSKWYYAPEVPGLAPQPEDGDFKDGNLKLKKQVQRFRVYAFDDQDRVIGEVQDAGAEISWRVHLANTKAAWYGFNNPLDNGDLAPGLPGQLRNQFLVRDEVREHMLLIDGGEREISGASVNADGGDPSLGFSDRFWDSADVTLGELRTDDAGRLLVVPADGTSSSPSGAPITSFADNDAWFDDWGDGPVNATVTLADGTKLEAEPSWVACVGPNFAPGIPSVTTLFDLIADLNQKEGWETETEGPISFRSHIYPTFHRLALMSWLTEGAHLRAGWLEAGNFADPAYIARLADPSEDNRTFREEVFATFRDPYNDAPDAYVTEAAKLPYMLGDGVNYSGSPLQWFRFPTRQYEHLRSWAAGDFVDDLEDATANAVGRLEDLSVEQQPMALTEAALEPCSGGAFHPGVELTYYLRLAELYARHGDSTSEPFRIAHGTRSRLLQNIGRLLTPEKAFEGDGDVPPPIGPQMAGDLTRWMGLPWQCDVFSCQQVHMQEDFPTAVWWPAQLPVDVLPEAYYEQVMRSDLPDHERLRFLSNRVAWSRGVSGIGYHASGSYWEGITNMISLWERMGFVVRRPGPVDADRPDGIPDDLFVEVGRGDMELRFDWTNEHGLLPK